MVFIRDSVCKLDEDTLCQEVLIPLLKAMGYQSVYYYHGGSGELGKDIVCWINDDLGNRKNLALVVKAVKVTGKATIANGTAGEISMQVGQCFGSHYLDPITSEPQNVHKCWVVSNKLFPKKQFPQSAHLLK